MVLRIEQMLLTCCSSISFVSKGKFSSFCLWFADKFDTDAEDWKPDFESDPARTRCSRCKEFKRVKTIVSRFISPGNNRPRESWDPLIFLSRSRSHAAVIPSSSLIHSKHPTVFLAISTIPLRIGDSQHQNHYFNQSQRTQGIKLANVQPGCQGCFSSLKVEGKESCEGGCEMWNLAPGSSKQRDCLSG